MTLSEACVVLAQTLESEGETLEVRMVYDDSHEFYAGFRGDTISGPFSRRPSISGALIDLAEQIEQDPLYTPTEEIDESTGA